MFNDVNEILKSLTELLLFALWPLNFVYLALIKIDKKLDKKLELKKGEIND